MRWQEILNQLKTRPQEELLTPSQRTVFDLLLPLLTSADRMNLCGPPGSGKTFVAWALARRPGAVYVPVPELLVSVTLATPCVLIDNAPMREAELRKLLATCNLRQIRSVVAITQEPTELNMRLVHLDSLNDEDWDRVRMTMLHLHVLSPPPRAADLWEYLRLCSR